MALGVRVDGIALPDDQAKALWERFSDWMEERKGDLAGFAAHEGFASVRPSVEAGQPVLLASKSAPQTPYAPVRATDAGGSPTRHAPGAPPQRGGPRNTKPSGKKRR